jgi:dihydropteroate synthase
MMARQTAEAKAPADRSSPPAAVPPFRRVLFVTGKLAEPALRRTLHAMAPPFAWDVAVLRITVAALMTTPWIARFLQMPPGTDLVLLPGLVEGDTALLAERFGVRVEKGPKDLREIPGYFGHAALARDYGAYDIEILAEINNAPKRSREDIRREAEYYHASGADLLDLGCTPGVPFPELETVVRELRAAGRRVSIDSFESAEILTAVAAGAELVLSVNGSNRAVVDRLRGTGARVVAIPDFGAGLDTLEPTLSALERAAIGYLIDPIIEPVGFGFMASLERYAETHRRYPGAGLLMGIGNITELTSADSTGVNAMLMAVCQELGVKAVLTTEVIPWARGAVREVDIARRLMYHAVTQKTLPKGVDDRLVTLKDPRILAYSEAELRELMAQVRDANFRIFTDRDTITVFNNALFVRGTDIQQIFDQLGVGDASHAFYLGKELMRARVAITLGKTYRQEGQLDWGYLTPPEEPRREHVKLTMRRTAGPADRRTGKAAATRKRPPSRKRPE